MKGLVDTAPVAAIIRAWYMYSILVVVVDSSTNDYR